MEKIKLVVKTNTYNGQVFYNLYAVSDNVEFPIQVVYGKTPNRNATAYLVDLVRREERKNEE